jgi:methyl-accepting chemotaxis protein
MTDRNRSLAAIGLLLAVLAVSIVVAVVSIVGLRSDRTVLQDTNVPYSVAIATAALNAKGMANDERGYLLSGRREFLDLLDQHLLNVRTAFAAAAFAADDARQHGAVEQSHARFERWVLAIRGQFKAFQSGRREAAARAALGQGREQRRSYEASLVDAEAAGLTPIKLNNPFVSTGWVAFLLLSLLLAVAICVALTVWLLRPPKPASDPAGSSQPLSPTIPVSASSASALRSSR